MWDKSVWASSLFTTVNEPKRTFSISNTPFEFIEPNWSLEVCSSLIHEYLIEPYQACEKRSRAFPKSRSGYWQFLVRARTRCTSYTDLIETSGNVDGVIGGHDAEALTEPGQGGSHGPGVCGGVVNLEQKPGPSGLWAFFPNPRPFFRDFCTQMEWLGFCLLFPTTLYHCVIREWKMNCPSHDSNLRQSDLDLWRSLYRLVYSAAAPLSRLTGSVLSQPPNQNVDTGSDTETDTDTDRSRI